ncbi:MAG: 50S ribosomal protein L11 methyltransferase, partial [Patescibacteria group bacterium]
MRELFEEAVRFVAKEDADSGVGTEITPAAEAAYLEMLKIYEGLTQEVIDDVVEETRDRVSISEVIGYIQDLPRTVAMMRGVNRAVNFQLDREKKNRVHVMDAGCGSGFLVAAAAALDDRVEATGIDCDSRRVAVSRGFSKRLGMKNHISERNLLLDSHDLSADVLIAEHLTRGLQTEMATQIPRAVEVNPNFVVPFAAQPVLYSQVSLLGIDQENGYTYELGEDLALYRAEKEIVLGQKGGDTLCQTTGILLCPPGLTPIAVGSDILWASRALGGAELRHKNGRDFPKQGTWEHHLMGPDLLHEGALPTPNEY